MINLFFSMIKNQLTRNDGLMDKPLWAAHNGCGFDFRFLWQRCVIRGIKPCIPIPYNSKPWEAVDTLFLWKGINKAGGSLDAICKAFGIPGKGDMDGSKVWDAVKEGRIKEVAEYCRDDVNKLRQIHKRMIAI